MNNKHPTHSLGYMYLELHFINILSPFIFFFYADASTLDFFAVNKDAQNMTRNSGKIVLDLFELLHSGLQIYTSVVRNFFRYRSGKHPLLEPPPFS